MARSTAPNPNVDVGVRTPATPAARPEQHPPLVVSAGRRIAGRGDAGVAGHKDAGVAGTRHFFRHLGEMFVAMMLGMMVLGGVDSGILSAFGTDIRHVRDAAPEAFALVMAFNMTVGMTLWMRYRRHSWAMCAEMAGAMFLPAIAALVLFWCSVIPTRSVGGVSMAAMVPAMLAVMLFRRTEYSQPVYAHAAGRLANAEVATDSHRRWSSHRSRERR